MSDFKASYHSPAVINGVLDWADKHLADIDVYLDEVPAGKACAGVAAIPSDPIFKRYRSGGALLKYEFVIMIRVPQSDTAAKLDAIAELSKLGDALKGSDWPLLGEDAEPFNGEMIANARSIGADDNGDNRYEAAYRLYYKTNS